MQSNYIPNIDLADIINKDLNSDAAVQVSNNIKKASEEIGFFTVICLLYTSPSPRD